MGRPLDDLPYRAMRELCVVVAEEIDHGFAEHVTRYHLPLPRREPLQAVPWANDRIADIDLARMAEVIEGEDTTIDEAARRFGFPISLARREMAVFYRLHDRWIFEHAMKAAG